MHNSLSSLYLWYKQSLQTQQKASASLFKDNLLNSVLNKLCQLKSVQVLGGADNVKFLKLLIDLSPKEQFMKIPPCALQHQKESAEVPSCCAISSSQFTGKVGSNSSCRGLIFRLAPSPCHLPLHLCTFKNAPGAPAPAEMRSSRKENTVLIIIWSIPSLLNHFLQGQ